MKTKITLLLFVLILLGCKTVKKNTQVVTEVNTSETTLTKNNTDSAATVKVVESAGSHTQQTDSVAVSETVTEFSKPDSVGQQYPTRITKREIKRVVNSKKETNNIRDSTAVTQKQEALSNQTDLKSDATQIIDTETKTKVKTPSIFNWAIILAILGALVFVYLILRRFGLIKKLGYKNVRKEII